MYAPGSSPVRAPGAAEALRRDLLINMENLQRLYTEEKDSRVEAEEELFEALQLVKQAQTMASNGRKEASAVRRRLVAVEQQTQETEAALRQQLAEAQEAAANGHCNATPGAPSPEKQYLLETSAAVLDELAADGGKFSRKSLDGWEAVHHAPSGRWCYFNAASGVVSWDLDGIVAGMRSRPSSLQQVARDRSASPSARSASPLQMMVAAPVGTPVAAPRANGLGRWAMNASPITPNRTPAQPAVVQRSNRRQPGIDPGEGIDPGSPVTRGVVRMDPGETRRRPTPPDLATARALAPAVGPGEGVDPGVAPARYLTAAVELRDNVAAEPVVVEPEAELEVAPEAAAPVVEGDTCLLLRNGALRSAAPLSSPTMHVVRAGERVKVLEVAMVWRFPLPGQPVRRARVALLEAPEASLGWVSVVTAGGDSILQNESSPAPPKRKAAARAAAAKPTRSKEGSPRSSQQQRKQVRNATID